MPKSPTCSQSSAAARAQRAGARTNLAASIAGYENVLGLEVPSNCINAGGMGSSARPPVDDAHGVRVCERLTHLVKVEEGLQVSDWGSVNDERSETKRTHAREKRLEAAVATCSLGKCAHLLIWPSIARHRSPSSMYLTKKKRDAQAARGKDDKGGALHHHIHRFAFGVEVDKFDMRSG
jgi:hypothetical protein